MKKMICFGDSLTEGADLDAGFTWPSLAANALNLEITNAGIGGDTSAGLLSRFYPEVVQKQPDFVLITCGTNDLWWDLDIRMILANIFSMVFQAQHYKITPVLGIPIPFHGETAMKAGIRPPYGGYEKCDRQLKRLAAELSEEAASSEIACVDFYQSFLEEGIIQADLFLEDGLHANQKGHRKMAQAAVNLMKSIFMLR